jgi:8-oxo-dGTP pyrophosphatase MutT (NUDIX family)
LGESLSEAARREALEETGHQVEDLNLYNIYIRDDKRLVWIVYQGTLGKGKFIENEETSELLFFSHDMPPPFDNLRGPLTRRLLHAILG